MTSHALTLAAGSLLDVDPLALVVAAAAAGFDGVGVRLTPALTRDERALGRIAERALDVGLAIHDVEVHRIGGAPADGHDDVGPLVDAAARLGARRVLVVSDLGDEAATRNALDEVVGRASARGVTVGLEYMAWTTPSDPAGAVRLATASGATIVVDLLHHVRVGAGRRELTDVVASGRLGWVQFCDAPITSPVGGDLLDEARHHRRPPGEGELPLAELLAVLPPDVTLSVEVQSDDLARRYPPTERAHHLLRATRRLLSEV